MKLGVCWYPEHWPETDWARDAALMREVGISVVRVGEFAWSRLQPREDSELQFDWLDRAVEVLQQAGHEIVMGTPTACPPKWLIDADPSVLACDQRGRPRGFGSRRHYSFSSVAYRERCRVIVEAMVARYGENPAVTAWQTDNEYGCHSTIVDYSDNAALAFRQWCRDKYDSIDALNTAWSNVFWSMEYADFEQIDPPLEAVTELNPAHQLAFWRFSSDQVVRFNDEQVSAIRRLSPGRDIMHNYMGNFCEFDHFDVAQSLDVAGWDSYPLGFLDRDNENEQARLDWLRTGHPDCAAFHHDLYRGVGKGRWWVIEQQPGPVNWAPHNPAPLPGMLKYWAMEALAHGAELCSFFRWRQHPGGQERHHTGLLLPNGEASPALEEVREVAAEIAQISADAAATTEASEVAILFDYVGNAALETQPQGANYDPQGWTQSLYRAVRRCGVDVDLLPVDAPLDGYRLIILANATVDRPALAQRLKQTGATVLIGPRSFSQDVDCRTPDALAPGSLQDLIPLRVIGIESLPDAVRMQAGPHRSWRWRERIESPLQPASTFSDGWGFHFQDACVHYLNAQLEDDSLRDFVASRLQEAGIDIQADSPGLRLRRRGARQYAFNAGPDCARVTTAQGELELAPGHYCHWQID